MKAKNISLINKLLVLAGVQIVILVFVSFFSFSNIKTRKIEKALFKGVTKDSIVSFEIGDRIDSFKAYKEGKDWFIQYEGAKLPGDREKINNYVTLLGSMAEGVVVFSGSDEENDESYGLGENAVQHLLIRTVKNKELKLDIGSVGARRGTTYVRKDGENRIRQINSELKAQSTALYKDWTNRRIIEGVALKDVAEIRIDSNLPFYKADFRMIVNPDETFSINPESANREVDDSLVRTFLNSLLTIKSDNFKIEGSVQGKELIAGIHVELNEGKKLLMEFYEADSEDIGNFVVRYASSPYLYLFHEETLEKLLKTKDSLYKIGD